MAKRANRVAWGVAGALAAVAIISVHRAMSGGTKTVDPTRPPAAPSVRMPVVSGEATCPLVAVYYEEDWGLRFRRLGPQVIVAVWEDGRIIWSGDQWKGGAPYRVGCVAPERVQKLLIDLDNRDLFKDPIRYTRRFPIDCPYTSITIAAGSKRLGMSSNHENIERAVRNRPNHSMGFADQPEDYRRFRQVWDDLRATLDSLIPEGSREAGGIKFEIRQLPPTSGR
jgi:hypothetical protein